MVEQHSGRSRERPSQNYRAVSVLLSGNECRAYDLILLDDVSTCRTNEFTRRGTKSVSIAAAPVVILGTPSLGVELEIQRSESMYLSKASNVRFWTITQPV
jgi:hypothetical protein